MARAQIGVGSGNWEGQVRGDRGVATYPSSHGTRPHARLRVRACVPACLHHFPFRFSPSPSGAWHFTTSPGLSFVSSRLDGN